MAKTRSTVVSPIYTGAYTRGINRSAAGILSRKKKGKPKTRADREDIARKAEQRATRVRRSVAKQRRIAEAYFKEKGR